MALAGKEIHRSYDEFGVIRVLDDGHKRFLSFGLEDEQSCILKSDPGLTQLDYVRAMLLVLVFTEPRRVLSLGLGAGSLCHALHQALPELKQQVVELRRGVVEVAYRYFQFPRSKRIEVFEMDAHAFLLTEETPPLDVIFSDLYDEGGIASQQMSPDFLFECSERLKSGGWLVLNCWKDHRSERVLPELKRYFAEVSSCTTQDGNWILLASKQPVEMSVNQRKQRIRDLLPQLRFSLQPYMNRLCEKI
ncbi:spermidine synthase [Nitrincola tapanii]|uniref:Spermidine synthase n=1 Tax=Nitrincola tapanii TaxID=1708751 RepID=A0A5A9W1I9_9GAMM|nr:fused MFS/spermidine synthase [Nitrincola tapanii]KAA0873975.1 spermidine synthase [Nitrincola tapanii]